MRSFQAIGGYFSAAKQNVKYNIQSFWQRDGVQAIYQGLTAPVYSGASFIKLVRSSQDLRTSLFRAVIENATFARDALILYIIYYHMVHPAFQESQKQLDSDSWIGSSMQWSIFSIDFSLYMAMVAYLKFKGL